MKRIIICADGTWNKPGNVEQGVRVATNVEKIYHSISNDKITQITYYDDGVGTKNTFFDKFIGGMTGLGLQEKIKKAYRFIVKHYQPGDELYFFGFSRGAYTVRSLAGLIRNAGIVKNESDVDEAFKLYRSKKDAHKPNGAHAVNFRKEKSHNHHHQVAENIPADTSHSIKEGAIEGGGVNSTHVSNLHDDHVIRIKFMGIWDTVGALGIPLGIFRIWNWIRNSFHDVTLSSTIDHAYHAISVDERRKLFTPSIWIKSTNDTYGTNKNVKQMWFAGVHSNVGGGYPDIGLSDISLKWIVKKAKEHDLIFTYDPVISPTACGTLYNSKTSFFELFHDYIRPISLKDGVKDDGSNNTTSPECNKSFHEYIHYSVHQRILYKENNYAPPNVFGAINGINTEEETKRLLWYTNHRFPQC